MSLEPQMNTKAPEWKGGVSQLLLSKTFVSIRVHSWFKNLCCRRSHQG